MVLENSKILQSLILVSAMLILSCREEKLVLNNPSINPLITNYSLQRFVKSPLAAMAIFDTNIPCKIDLIIKGQDGEDLTQKFPEYSVKHEIPILGLYPDFKNEVTLIIESTHFNKTELILSIKTQPLPKIFPELILVKNDEQMLSDEMYFLYLVRVDGGKNQADYPIAVDKYGKVRWFYYGEYNYILKRIKDNNLIIVENSVFWNGYENI